jgi:hypothetical protein
VTDSHADQNRAFAAPRAFKQLQSAAPRLALDKRAVPGFACRSTSLDDRRFRHFPVFTGG